MILEFIINMKKWLKIFKRIKLIKKIKSIINEINIKVNKIMNIKINKILINLIVF